MANLVIKNNVGTDVSLTLDRDSNASWRFLNSNGILYVQNDFTSAKGDYFNVLTLNYNTGDAIFKGDVAASGGNFTGGLTVSGRIYGSGDDEGIIISKASNGYAGLCLGSYNGVRSVFYLDGNNNAFWRYHNGSTTGNIYHPAKDGTIALTSDLDGKLSLSGGIMTGRFYAGSNLCLWTDNEGGNIDIIAPPDNGAGVNYWENDAYDGNLRWYCVKTDGTLVHPVLSVTPTGIYILGSKAITAENTETWKFTLTNGTTVTKKVCIV